MSKKPTKKELEIVRHFKRGCDMVEIALAERISRLEVESIIRRYMKAQKGVK